MRNRRPRTSLVLVGLGVLLLVSIAIGQQIGDHALFSATQHRLAFPDDSITPVPDPTTTDDPTLSKDWKRLQVVSVATDPAFPDPRVTPPPTPTPRPAPPAPKATPTPTPSPLAPADLYTSPPLPLPLVSHEPEATATPTAVPE
jgi:hypothetical protein